MCYFASSFVLCCNHVSLHQSCSDTSRKPWSEDVRNSLELASCDYSMFMKGKKVILFLNGCVRCQFPAERTLLVLSSVPIDRVRSGSYLKHRLQLSLSNWPASYLWWRVLFDLENLILFSASYVGVY